MQKKYNLIAALYFSLKLININSYIRSTTQINLIKYDKNLVKPNFQRDLRKILGYLDIFHTSKSLIKFILD